MNKNFKMLAAASLIGAIAFGFGKMNSDDELENKNTELENTLRTTEEELSSTETLLKEIEAENKKLEEENKNLRKACDRIDLINPNPTPWGPDTCDIAGWGPSWFPL